MNSKTHLGTSRRSWMRYVCHQRIDRCFKINGRAMQICSRCLGIYLGLAIGLFIPFIFWSILLIDVKIMFMILIFALIPMALDGFTQLIGLRNSNNNLRFITGLLSGLILGLVFSWLLIKILIL